jgi:hypothetical protein
MTRKHLQWLRILQNPLLYWMIILKLEKLNDDTIDYQLIDRTLEFGEGLESLAHTPGIATSEGCTDFDYMMQGYKEYLEGQGDYTEEYV